MAVDRKIKRTRFPGIFKVERPGRPARYMVSYRIRGVGQRTKTLLSLEEAKIFQGSIREPSKRRQLGQLEKGRVPLADWFDLFLDRRRNLTLSTRDRYEGVGRLYIKPGWLGAMWVSEITRDDVERWVTELEQRAVGPATIDKAYRTLRAALNVAVREGRATYNPATQIRTPDVDHRVAFFLTAGLVDQIAGAVPPRHRALVYFLAYTGARIGEASALRVRHLDLTRRVASISESSPEVAGRKVTGKTKTKRVRAIELPAALCLELSRHLEQYGPRQSTGVLDTNGWVFSHSHGGQIRQNNWRSRVFQPACLRAGVLRPGKDGRPETPRVHDLRHTAASLAAQAGYSLHEVKELLGHSTITTTSDLYLHLFTDTKREKAEKLGDLLTQSRTDRGHVIQLHPA